MSRVSAILLTAVTALPWLLIPCTLLMLLLLAIRWYYLATARDLKRLEGLGEMILNLGYGILCYSKFVYLNTLCCTVIQQFSFCYFPLSLSLSLSLPPCILSLLARSPVYSHISATLQGLPTIRSFNKTQVSLKQLHHYQNEHSRVGGYVVIYTVKICIFSPSRM